MLSGLSRKLPTLPQGSGVAALLFRLRCFTCPPLSRSAGSFSARTDVMITHGMDLTDFDVVRSSAASISERLKCIGGRRVLPPPDRPLTPPQIKLFDTWIAEGFPP